MALQDRIEGLYLGIWRGIVLFVSSVALIVAVAAFFGALRGLFSGEPYPPREVRVEDRAEALKRNLSIGAFKESGLYQAAPAGAGKAAGGAQSEADRAASRTLQRIAENLDNYSRIAFPEGHSTRDAIAGTIRSMMQEHDLRVPSRREFYLSTLEELSEDLLRIARDQATMPARKRIDAHRFVRWHAEAVYQVLERLNRENEKLQQGYQRQVIDYANSHARTVSYAGVAAAAFGIFVFTVFLFFVIRIERALKTMAVASLLTSRQLDAATRQGAPPEAAVVEN